MIGSFASEEEVSRAYQIPTDAKRQERIWYTSLRICWQQGPSCAAIGFRVFCNLWVNERVEWTRKTLVST
jgi:hypothetical protein